MTSLAPLAQVFAVRSATRTEADVQQNLGAFLTLAPLGLADNQVSKVEVPTGDGTRRRIDVEYGRLIIEVKKDLTVANAVAKAEPQLQGYLKVKRDATGDEYAGIITDGVEWLLYTLAGDEFKQVQTFTMKRADADSIERLTNWLDGILLTGPKLSPTPARIEERLGANSPRFRLDRARLEALYKDHGNDAETTLKRDLWARLLRTALGTNFEDDAALFLDHTLLVIEAEIIAHLVVGLDPAELSANDVLAGAAFKSAGIIGVVEADFFDWPAKVDGGPAIIADLIRELGQFKWEDVKHDVLKHLYEAIISAETRKGLGEYYTADWLAKSIVDERITDPLNERVMDPACGSGTFVFHAVRRFLDAADAAGFSNRDALTLLQETVFGMDIHPVSVVLARVTYLLAIGPERLQDRGTLSIPVFLGDSVQWGRGSGALTSDVFTMEVDAEDLAGSEAEDEQLGGFAETLTFPLGADPTELDLLIADLADLAAQYIDATKPIPGISHILKARGVKDPQADVVRASFKKLCELNAAGRDHIWGYVVRNQIRPLWLARNPVDVLVGNPPWVAYRYMTRTMQSQFKAMLESRELWAGGAVATNQDLAALFIARTVEVFLKPGGTFGFVTPYAVLSRLQYELFRTGDWLDADPLHINTAFETSWDLADVRPPLFPVPSAVIFGTRADEAVALPEEVIAFRGRVGNIVREDDTVIQLSADDAYLSPYSSRPIQGATVVPRVLTFIDEVPAGMLGRPAGTTAVKSARSTQEKKPWKFLDSVETPVEESFVREVLLGSSMVPYRVVWPHKAVLPITDTGVLQPAQMVHFPMLSARWTTVEGLWNANKSARTKQTLTEWLDYQGKLRRQLPAPAHRVVYTASGNRIAAAYTSNTKYVIEHKLYWLHVDSEAEGHYLAAILNSDAVAVAVAKRQSRGLFGTRDIDMLPWRLPIPAYDADNATHVALSDLGTSAAATAESLDFTDEPDFKNARRVVREALAADGTSAAIDELVIGLLDLNPSGSAILLGDDEGDGDEDAELELAE